MGSPRFGPALGSGAALGVWPGSPFILPSLIEGLLEPAGAGKSFWLGRARFSFAPDLWNNLRWTRLATKVFVLWLRAPVLCVLPANGGETRGEAVPVAAIVNNARDRVVGLHAVSVELHLMLPSIADLYAVAALAAAAVVVIGNLLHLSSTAATIAGAALCFGLRVMAIRRGWHLPVAPPQAIRRGASKAKRG
jgi:hypothetical protein